MPGSRRFLLGFRSRYAGALRIGALVTSVLLAAACGGDSVSPPAAPAALRIDGGNLQEGTVGQQLPVLILVTVLDASNRPLADARVTFNAAPGAGSITPGSTQTNANGQAQARWTLGTTSGTAIATATVNGVSSATFTATVRAGPATQLIATPGSLTLGVGDTLQLNADTRDQFGNAVDQSALVWSSLEPAVAQVVAGKVTALVQGTARAVVSTASASGTLADTVSIAVGPPGSSFCGTRTTAELPVGGVALFTAAVGAAEQCLSASVAGTEYALVAINTSPSFGTTVSLDALALGVGPAPAASVFAAAASGLSGPLSAVALPPATLSASAFDVRTDGGFERALRKRERTELAPFTTAARERFGAGGRSTSTLSSQVALPAVGSTVTLNGQALSACSQPNNRTGRVVAVSERAILVADTENPSGGYTDAEYAEIAATFDTLTYPLDVEYFGEPTDVGGTGRITLFYTRAVNQLTPAGANFVVGGFFFARDLYPKTARNGLAACSSSNERELMYLLVADPDGEVNGNTRTKADVTRLNRTTVAHELQHLINAGRRLLVTPNAILNEEVWLDEGLAHTAEELLYFRTANFTSRQNLGLQQVAPNPTKAELFTAFAAQNFARWTSYLKAPESQSPFAPNDSLATRGAAWHFLRYAAGRQPQQEATFYRQLVAGPQAGIANLTAALPGGSLSLWLRDWAIAVFADDFAGSVASQYRVPAWNFRSILPALTFGGQPLGSFPLVTRTLASNVERSLTLAGGGSGYLRFTVPADKSALVSVSVNGQAPGSTVQLGIIRYR